MGELTTLPSGTVTLLFSDIEGSTDLLRELGDRWGDTLADHRRLVRDACTSAGGREVDTQGDAFFFAFPRARDGLQGAAAAQRALAAHRWPDGAQVRVRMGLHTGEPTVGEEGYLGLDVVRAARICSAAHGGQVLVSETTRALVGAAQVDGLEFRDLGDHLLKGMTGGERIYQLEAPGLETEFPPIRTDRPAAPPMRLEGLDTRVAEVVQDFGASIEREVNEALRAAGVPRVPASATGKRSGDTGDVSQPGARLSTRASVWLLLTGVLVAIPIVWILAREL